MCRRLFYVLLCLLWPCIALAKAPCPLPADYTPIAERYETGLLFKVSSCGVTNYLFGTFHSDDPMLRPMLHDAKQAITNSDYAAFEIVLDEQAKKQVLVSLLLPPDKPGLNQLLPRSVFTKLQANLAHIPINPEQINRFKPWAVAVLMQYPQPKADGMVIDEQLQQYAMHQNKQLFGLESVQEQFAIFDNLSLDEQIAFLEASLDDIDSINENMARLQTLYANKDMRGIAALGRESFDAIEDDALGAYLENALLTKRNYKMAGWLSTPLQLGGMFVAVGALHLPGESGLLHLLEQQGYRITVAD